MDRHFEQQRQQIEQQHQAEMSRIRDNFTRQVKQKITKLRNRELSTKNEVQSLTTQISQQQGIKSRLQSRLDSLQSKKRNFQNMGNQERMIDSFYLSNTFWLFPGSPNYVTKNYKTKISDYRLTKLTRASGGKGCYYIEIRVDSHHKVFSRSKSAEIYSYVKDLEYGSSYLQDLETRIVHAESEISIVNGKIQGFQYQINSLNNTLASYSAEIASLQIRI